MPLSARLVPELKHTRVRNPKAAAAEDRYEQVEFSKNFPLASLASIGASPGGKENTNIAVFALCYNQRGTHTKKQHTQWNS